MDDSPEFVLKKLCCTCLSQDRKLTQLCRLTEGINNLYLLLSYDSEAYREGFYKDTAHWFICWECWAVMRRFSRFRSQACEAQRQLADIVDGRTDLKLANICLSRLTQTHKTSYNETICNEEEVNDNFIDCGDIKAESDEDVPLSELHSNYLADDRHYSDDDIIMKEIDKEKSLDIQPVYKKRKKINTKRKKKEKSKKQNGLENECNKDYFTTVQMTEEEMKECRENKKMAATYADAKFKCEFCIEGFKSQISLNDHILETHTKKDNYSECDICLSYIPLSTANEHRSKHYIKYQCCLCEVEALSDLDILTHLDSHSGVNKDEMLRKRGRSKGTLNKASKPRRSAAMLDKRTPFGYKCAECDKYFDNKNLRWKHVQRLHREGFACGACGKRFAFRNNLARHQLMHEGPPPREECPHCHKQVRVDLLKVHLRIHSHRQRFACAECDKRFASRASYEHHLKYTAKHAQQPLHKYKCSMCDKGYRSRGELRDHVNYQHMGKTQHKCPVCEKALATPRCVTRHVRRAHLGVKEQARDKVCQQCGRTFRDKKTLREHEFIHTGERPLACEICGCTFRQSASLYTHRKRVHKIYPPQKNVQLMQPAEKEQRP